MLNIDKMIASAKECLGWPYESPGTNDARGIDCSGLLVKIFRDQGGSIYHGSNTIFHEYCSETGKILDIPQLKPGMAVFKVKSWMDDDKNNRWYGKEPGNVGHIGLVVSGSPNLQIIHASSEAEKVVEDTRIGKWSYWGKLKNVDYSGTAASASTGGGGGSEPSAATEKTADSEPQYATVQADSATVKMRFRPSKKCSLYDEVPVGAKIEVLAWGDEWSTISYGKRVGWYMLTEFLKKDGKEAVASKPAEPVIERPKEPENAEQKPVTADRDVYAGVVSPNGAPVKMRSKPTTKNGLYDELPMGTIVKVERVDGEWTKVTYRNRKGWYIMSEFLKEIKNEEEKEQ